MSGLQRAALSRETGNESKGEGDGEKEEDEKEEEKRRLATTRLLNSQAGKFDVVDVCKLSFTFHSNYFLTLFYFI